MKTIKIDDIEYILTPVKPDDNVKQIFKHGDWVTTPNSWVKYVNRFGSEVQVPEEIDYIGNHGKVYFTNRSVGACTRIKCMVKATDEELIDYFYYKNKINFKEGDTVRFNTNHTDNTTDISGFIVDKFLLQSIALSEISAFDLIVRLKSNNNDGEYYHYLSSYLEKSDSEDKRFNNLVTPLIKYIAENHSPHSVLIIDNTTATIYDGYKSHIDDSFIVD